MRCPIDSHHSVDGSGLCLVCDSCGEKLEGRPTGGVGAPRSDTQALGGGEKPWENRGAAAPPVQHPPGKIAAPKPGLYRDVEGVQYASWDAISYRRLTDFQASPYRAWWFQRYPEDRPEPGLPAELGIVFHAALLEPDLYARKFRALPEGRSNSKAVVAATSKILADGLRPVRADHAATVERMLESALAHPQIQKLLARERMTEVSLVGEDAGTRLLLKDRADLIVPETKMCIDVKTLGRELSRAEIERSYVWSWAQQLDKVARTLAGAMSAAALDDLEIEHFGVLAIEQKPPFECGLVFPGEPTMQLAHRHLSRVLEEYRRCVDTGHWPRFGEAGIVGVEAPGWAFYKYDEGDTIE